MAKSKTLKQQVLSKYSELRWLLYAAPTNEENISNINSVIALLEQQKKELQKEAQYEQTSSTINVL